MSRGGGAGASRVPSRRSTGGDATGGAAAASFAGCGWWSSVHVAVWLTVPTILLFASSSDYRCVVSEVAPTDHRSSDSELPSHAQVKAAVTAFSMLAEPTRLQLLWLVSAEELDVSTLAARLEATVSVVSAHLAKLRLAGLVDTRKAGRHVLYRVRDVHVRSLIAEALFHADHQVSGSADHG